MLVRICVLANDFTVGIDDYDRDARLLNTASSWVVRHVPLRNMVALLTASATYLRALLPNLGRTL